MSWCKVSIRMNPHFISQIRSISYSILDLAAAKEARVMNKLLNRSPKRRSWYPSKEISASSLPSNFLPQKGERSHRRINILNKLFMRYVSDIMSTGEISNEIAGLRLEISKVMISEDFGTLNVFWVTKGTKVDNEIEDILKRNAGKLRHELSQLRVVGNVPAVQFVKDKSLSKLTELDAILTMADFGEEYEPTDPSLKLIADFVSKPQNPTEVIDKDVMEDDLDPLPPMAMDVLGFNHDMVMQKILRSMSKSQALHRRKPAAVESDADSLVASESEIQSSIPSEGKNDVIALDKLELKKFISKRLAQQRKLCKPPNHQEWGKEILFSEKLKDEDLDDEELLASHIKTRQSELDSYDCDNFVEDNDSYLYNREDR